MNKTELINAVAETSGLTKKDSEVALNAILDTIQNAMKNGDIRMLLEIRPFVVAYRGEQISGKLVLCRTGSILTNPHSSRPPL